MTVVSTIRSGLQARASQTLEEAFPEVNWLVTALGNQVIVQLRNPKKMTAGGILLTEDSRDTDMDMVRVAKVVEIGPLAYRKRDSMEQWPEGAWVKVGDYVRVPSYAGVDAWKIWHREHIESRGGKEIVIPEFVKFASFNDYDIKGRIKGDPLEIVDYV